MKVKILEERHNPFMKRKELAVHIDHDSEPTPSMQALAAFLAKDLNINEDKIEILNIYSARGAAHARSQVHVWDEKKPEKKQKKKKEKAESKKAETKKETK